ncbi:hypothetical protein BR93DRAFT_766850 [Coniochaeta sp. PMI_546]|nr:hypothetical protein BR93DRAFT_766850 [Coniochaeta sp. PMI_546]
MEFQLNLKPNWLYSPCCRLRRCRSSRCWPLGLGIDGVSGVNYLHLLAIIAAHLAIILILSVKNATNHAPSPSTRRDIPVTQSPKTWYNRHRQST